MRENIGSRSQKIDGQALAKALKNSRRSFFLLLCLSAILNIFVLNGSIYMMLVYDKALPSQNIATLVGLFALSTFVYIVQGFFEVLRSDILADVASEFESSVAAKAISSAHNIALKSDPADRSNSPMRDLDQIRSFIAGPGPAALMDLPWIIFFLAILSLLHVWLGVAALGGAAVLVCLTVVSEKVNKASGSSIAEMSQRRNRLTERMRRSVETLQALGMKSRFSTTFLRMNFDLSANNRAVSSKLAMVSTASRTMRMFIQSALLTVGAWLVINGMVSGGIIFASSILAGRALAPIDQAIAQWRNFSLARASWARLNQTLAQHGEPGERTRLPKPTGQLELADVVVVPPGAELPTLQNVSFACEAGSVVGVIGPSGAGKSSLARALVGAWPLLGGTIRLDGATIDQWDSDCLGQHLGYLPQTVELLEGTVAQNISRFDPEASSDAVVAAAELAGVHRLTLNLPNGYETEVGEDGRNLSAGQRQRIGLARALYNNPSFVVLDEPNSNLDPSGDQALGFALINLRKSKVTAVIVTHRQPVLKYCTHLLYLADGKVRTFGPRDEVLTAIKNSSNVHQISEAS